MHYSLKQGLRLNKLEYADYYCLDEVSVEQDDYIEQ